MSYPLRLPPALDIEARALAQRLGISLNALKAVALDAYLRGQPPVGPTPATEQARPSIKRATRNKSASPKPSPDGRPDWKFFHPNPDVWPYHDPEFAHRFEVLAGETDLCTYEAAASTLELEYWSTRERPPYP